MPGTSRSALRRPYAAVVAVLLTATVAGCGGGDAGAGGAAAGGGAGGGAAAGDASGGGAGGSGAGGSGGAGGAATAGRAAGAGSLVAFAECMRQNGVVLPSGRPSAWPSGRPTAWPSGRPTAWPSGRPSGRPGGGFGGFRSMDPATRKAFEACRSLMPQGGQGGFGRRGGDPQALQAFRTCMKDNGAEISGAVRVRDLATADPKAAKAYEKCRVLLPAATPTPAPGS
ncbi:hypothetical protein [Microbispora sp. H10949]|uniref:hypothetical protein n=1 Tax=Microbispora sp. H10949 TaxID=2729111 RepID=UPI0016033FA5|nr:hypothetical protein [Microbispora sp. H10949]